MKTLIKNAAVVLPDGILPESNVLFDNTILYVGGSEPSADRVIDGGGLVLSPGFIDIHTHGCGGADTMDGGDAVLSMARLAVKCGTTSFLPTTVSAPAGDIHRALEGVRSSMTCSDGANVLGAHVEGPFLSAKYKGAHEESTLTNPDFEIISDYTDVVKLVALAPELDGARAFIEQCSGHGIICSIGHTNAAYAECAEALGWGARSFTHSYNAMSPLNHREPGAVGALLSLDCYAELICDNIHVSPPAQNILFRLKGPEQTILITDAMRACMVGDGQFTLGGLDVTVRGERVLLKDGTLAGSVLTMNKAAANLIAATGCELYEAVRCAALNPAALLGLTSKGRITAGCDADLVLITHNFDVVHTFVGGRCVQ